jgi:hypothetical protein
MTEMTKSEFVKIMEEMRFGTKRLFDKRTNIGICEIC